MLALVLAACGGKDNTDTKGSSSSGRRPARVLPTPTLRSTPLPQGSSAPVVGSPERPIRILFALLDSTVDKDTKSAGTDLESTIEDNLNARLDQAIPELTVKVDFVTSTEALDAVCGRDQAGAPTLAWVDSFSAAAAHAECGAEPALAILRSKGSRATIGRTADIIARTDITRLSDLNGRVFCRSDEQDVFTSWIFPGLMLSGQNVDPFSNLSAVNSYPTDTDLMMALYKGDCAAAALPPDTFDKQVNDLIDALDAVGQSVSGNDVENVIKVLVPAGDTAEPTNVDSWKGYDANVVPYETLVLSPTTIFPGQTLRTALVETISDFFNDSEEGTARLRDLLNSASGIIPVTSNQYQAFAETLSLAKWDMVFAQ